MKYEGMSDYQISKLIAEYIYPKKIKLVKATKNNVVDVWLPNGGLGFYKHEYVDYCNNPADMWPIIERERITVTPYEDKTQGWFATTDTSFFVDDKKPLRAAAIVFLMMKESVNV